MRIAIHIDDELLRDARQLAASTGLTINEVIEEALRETVKYHDRAVTRERVVLPFSSGRLQPGVNLDDSSALLDLMEGENPS